MPALLESHTLHKRAFHRSAISSESQSPPSISGWPVKTITVDSITADSVRWDNVPARTPQRMQQNRCTQEHSADPVSGQRIRLFKTHNSDALTAGRRVIPGTGGGGRYCSLFSPNQPRPLHRRCPQVSYSSPTTQLQEPQPDRRRRHHHYHYQHCCSPPQQQVGVAGATNARAGPAGPWGPQQAQIPGYPSSSAYVYLHRVWTPTAHRERAGRVYWARGLYLPQTVGKAVAVPCQRSEHRILRS